VTRRPTLPKRIGFAVLVLCATALVGSIIHVLFAALVAALGLPSWAAIVFIAIVSFAASAYYRIALVVTLASVVVVGLLIWRGEPVESEPYECAPEPASVEIEL
jgi:hypothetical protein